MTSAPAQKRVRVKDGKSKEIARECDRDRPTDVQQRLKASRVIARFRNNTHADCRNSRSDAKPCSAASAVVRRLGEASDHNIAIVRRPAIAARARIPVSPNRAAVSAAVAREAGVHSIRWIRSHSIYRARWPVDRRSDFLALSRLSRARVLGRRAGHLGGFGIGVWHSLSNPLRVTANRSGSLTILASGALILVLVLGAVAMSKSRTSTRKGNGRLVDLESAREFLASDFPSRAWSPLLSNTHPEYPLLVSGAVEATGGAAAAVSFLFFAALIAMVTGGLAFSRGPLAGLVAGLALASSGALLHEVPSQYADIPLATYLAGALIFILVDRPAFAGVLAGFAVWTKDEGALFCLAILALVQLSAT